MIPDHIIDEIRQRADIVEVVSDYLPLKKSGANYRALCPFHEEKTPSFNVNSERQIFHCFGCGEGGNVFTFVMKIENISFPEAARMLGRRYGVVVPEAGGGERASSELDALYRALEDAADFYHRLLLGQRAGSPVLEYLKKRRVTDEMIKAFRLGWAPDSWDALHSHLKSRGIDDKVAEKAGLIKVSSRGNYIDRFRARLIFPITNPGGRVIGFGGRIIEKGAKEAAKYINSPETQVYNKSSVLYGLHQATEAARREGVMMVVEGYMDVLALHEAGVRNCVACSGTAFTARQAELVKRVCDKVIVLFDSDTAGIAAAKRSLPVLLDHGVGARVLTLPGSKDPDEFLASHGVEEFLKLAGEAPAFQQFIIDIALSGTELATVEGKVAAAREVIPFLRRIKDNIERSHYIQQLAERTGTDFETLRREVERGAGRGGERGDRRAGEREGKSVAYKAERILLRILLDRPEFLDGPAADLGPEDFTDQAHVDIFKLLLKAREAGTEAVSLAEDDDIRRRITALTMEDSLYDQENAEEAAADCVRSLRYGPDKRKRALELLKSSARTAEGGGFSEAQKKYLEFRKKWVK